MKILILMRSSILTNRGGAEIQADFIRQALVDAGHEVHFAFEAKTKMEGTDDSTHYHVLPHRGRLRSYLNAFAVAKLVRGIKPDIIYQRVRFSYTGIAAFLAKRYGAFFIHGISADYACKKNQVPLATTVVSQWINECLGRYGIRHADVLIAQTGVQGQMLKEYFGLDSMVIPNGHPVPEDSFEKEDPPVIAWVANLKRWKQPEIFIGMAKELCDCNARFIMAGKPADARLEAEITNSLKDAPNVEYLGQLSLEQVNELLSRASVFVNTSQPREGFPNTFIQAWMRKTPVVTLNFDPDGVIAGQGIGFHSGSIGQLREDVHNLIHSKDLCRDMGNRARVFALHEYDFNIVGRRYVDLLEKYRDPARWTAVTP